MTVPGEADPIGENPATVPWSVPLPNRPRQDARSTPIPPRPPAVRHVPVVVRREVVVVRDGDWYIPPGVPILPGLLVILAAAVAVMLYIVTSFHADSSGSTTSTTTAPVVCVPFCGVGR